MGRALCRASVEADQGREDAHTHAHVRHAECGQRMEDNACEEGDVHHEQQAFSDAVL